MTVLIALLILLALLYVQMDYYLFQYLYFLRVPILCGAILVGLPFAAAGAHEMTRNWFQVSAVGLSIVSLLAVLSAWSIMYALGFLYIKVLRRNKLPFARDAYETLKAELSATGTTTVTNSSKLLASQLRYPVFGLLAGPTIYFSFTLADVEGIEIRWLAVAVGLSIAAVVPWAVWGVQAHPRLRTVARGIVDRLCGGSRSSPSGQRADMYEMQLTSDIPAAGELRSHASPGSGTREKVKKAGRQGLEALKDGLRRADDMDPNYRQCWMWGYGTMLVAIWIVGFFVLDPTSRLGTHAYFPVLGYLLVLLMIVGFLLSLATIYADKFRIPALLPLVALPLLVGPGEHTYRLTPISGQAPRNGVANAGARAAYDSWAKANPSQEVATVVAASGGGIKAAAWTAKVLTGLQQQLTKSRGEQAFGRSIVFVSAVSGGSVGAMYYVDRYAELHPPSASDAEEVFADASASSLDAVGWGLVYPDLVRAFTGLSLESDRAWAQEQRWNRRLRTPGRTISDWSKGVMEGWRPLMVFNATLVETGEPLAIAPVPLADPATDRDRNDFGANSGRGGRWRAREHLSLYPGMDMQLVTAARLSATFPYVTPIARPSQGADTKRSTQAASSTGSTARADWGYQVADGGYFDNYGVATMLDYIRSILEAPHSGFPGHRLLIVQIRASRSDRNLRDPSEPTLTDVVTGPLETMLNVRTASQKLRNDRELDQLHELWKPKQSICSVTFEMTESAPLSWHLSRTEIEAITKAWSSKENQKALSAAVAFFNTGSCAGSDEGNIQQ